MKYHVLHDFITSARFEEKSSDHFKDLHKMELLKNFDISLTSFLGGVMNQMFNAKFGTPFRNDVILSSKLVRSFSL